MSSDRAFLDWVQLSEKRVVAHFDRPIAMRAIHSGYEILILPTLPERTCYQAKRSLKLLEHSNGQT